MQFVSGLESFNSHILFVVCSFFEFGTISKWCIREWVKVDVGLKKRVKHDYVSLYIWDREKETENRNGQTLRQSDRDRQTDRQTDR